jgi:hypothetical protein
MRTYDEIASTWWVKECERRLDNNEPFLGKEEYIKRNKYALGILKKYSLLHGGPFSGSPIDTEPFGPLKHTDTYTSGDTSSRPLKIEGTWVAPTVNPNRGDYDSIYWDDLAKIEERAMGVENHNMWRANFTNSTTFAKINYEVGYEDYAAPYPTRKRVKIAPKTMEQVSLIPTPSGYNPFFELYKEKKQASDHAMDTAKYQLVKENAAKYQLVKENAAKYGLVKKKYAAPEETPEEAEDRKLFERLKIDLNAFKRGGIW